MSHKNKLNDTQKIKLFLEWIINDCSSTPVSTIFALLFFSPQSSTLGTMVKNINSSNGKKIKDGLKNSAWDLAYITKLRKLSRNQPENIFWFFCSHDKVLQKIAKNLYLKEGQEIQVALNNLIVEFWGKKKGKLVFSYYERMAPSIVVHDEKRIQHNRKIRLKIDQMTKDLEINVFPSDAQT